MGTEIVNTFTSLQCNSASLATGMFLALCADPRTGLSGRYHMRGLIWGGRCVA